MDRKKFKELTFRKKIEWLIHYYGIAAIVAVIAVIVVISLVKSVFFPKPLEDMCVLILCEDMGQEEAFDLQDVIEANTGKTAQVSSYIVSDVYGRQAFSVRLNADTLDIVIAPGEEKDGMTESGYLVKSEPLTGYEDLYIGTTIRSRQGELLDQTYEIVKDYFAERK